MSILRNEWRFPYWYVSALLEGAVRSSLFAELNTYCGFIGYPRSGHSLLGALLNAHKNAVVSHELDVFKYLQVPMAENQLYSMILAQDRRFMERNQRWQGYKYAVPDQYQGHHEDVRVIGDKKGGRSTLRLDDNPGLLDRLRGLVDLRMRFIHMTRNPFDNINTIANKRGILLEDAVDEYFYLCEAVLRIKDRFPAEEWCELCHEDLVRRPERTLRRVCDFLGLEYSDEYGGACADIIFDEPKRTREPSDWDSALVEGVKGRMASLPFLDTYVDEPFDV